METTIDYKGYTIKIKQDFDPLNPRKEWDNLGTIVYWYNRYELGDVDGSKEYGDGDDFLQAMQQDKDAVMLPVYMYDHSGQTISTTPFSCQWDGGQIGWIYASSETIKKEWGEVTDETKEKAKNCLKAEIECFDNYITGNVYGYVVEDSNGECIESCCGYNGEDGVEQAIEEAKGIVDYEMKQRIKSHINRLKAQIKTHTPLYARNALQLA